MLVIGGEQMRVLRERQLRHFEDDMVRSIAVDFEPKFNLLGEAGIRRLIRKAIADGAETGIEAQGAVAVLIELRVQFGERFEFSPDRPWAEKLLAHPTLPDYIKVDTVRRRMTALTEGRTLMPARAATPAPESPA